MSIARFGLLAVGIGATMAVIALIGGTAFFFQHHRSERTSVQTAEAEFERIRTRFAAQRPLLDMHERRPKSDVGGPQPGAPLHSFNTIIFDTRGGERLQSIASPFRLDRDGRFHPGKDRATLFIYFRDTTLVRQPKRPLPLPANSVKPGAPAKKVRSAPVFRSMPKAYWLTSRLRMQELPAW